jgi:Golgi nucleoside diphosphatase
MHILSENAETLLDHGIVIDAGSSHTSMIVYQWPSIDGWKRPNELQEVTNCYIDNGIDSFENNPQGAYKVVFRVV